MLRLSILPEGYIYPKETWPLRDLLRKRTMLVRHRTAQVLGLQNMVNRNTGRKLKVNDAKRLGEEKIIKLFEDGHLIMAVQSDKAVIDFFHEQIESIEKVVQKEAKLRYPYEELLTVPGIGKILGITIMLETGGINRFPTVSAYSSYCRCVSFKKLFNGKKKGEGNKKNENKYLTWAYVETKEI